MQNSKFCSKIPSLIPDICLKFIRRWAQISCDVWRPQIYYIRILLISIFRRVFTPQKMNFFIKDFFSKYEQICSFLRTCSHLLKKSLMENFLVQCLDPFRGLDPSQRMRDFCLLWDYLNFSTGIYFFESLTLGQFSPIYKTRCPDKLYINQHYVLNKVELLF